MPVNTDGTATLGPGTLKIGATGTEVDVSCLVNSVTVGPDISEGETKTMLCGTEKRSADTMTWSLSGNVDVDAGEAAGLFALSWSEAGTVQDFTYTPNTELGTVVAGQLRIQPLDLGADEYGSYLSSDFEWALVDFDPTTALTIPPVVPLTTTTSTKKTAQPAGV